MSDTAAPSSDDAPIASLVAVGLTLVSGIAYGLSFPPLALRPLVWIALVPWLVAIQRGSLRRAMGLGALWACVETWVTSDCLPGAVVNYYQQPFIVGWLMLLGATVITMVPYYGSFAACYWVLARRYRGALPLLAAAAWVAAELARVKVLGGNPWAVSGYSQVGVLPLMQIADLVGVHGISFTIAAVNVVVADFWMVGIVRSSGRRLAPGGIASVGVILALVLAYGLVRLHDAELCTPSGRPTRVAIIQANLDLGSQWRQDMYGKNLDTYLRMSWEAGRESRPELIFWPESAMTFFLPREPAYRAAIGRVLSPLGVELMAGGPRMVESAEPEDPTYFNSTFLVSSRGEILAWQDKIKLLPFAEYFPFQGVALLRRDFGRARQFTPGEAQPPLPSVAGRAGVIVCNEAMYPEPARDLVAQGAQLLVNPANDSWFGSLKYSLQAFDFARLRAVEQRRYLVRTSTAGPSAIVDPAGRVVRQTAPFEAQWTADLVRRCNGVTIYQRIGDLFAYACALAAFLALGFASIRRA